MKTSRCKLFIVAALSLCLLASCGQSATSPADGTQTADMAADTTLTDAAPVDETTQTEAISGSEEQIFDSTGENNALVLGDFSVEPQALVVNENLTIDVINVTDGDNNSKNIELQSTGETGSYHVVIDGVHFSGVSFAGVDCMDLYTGGPLILQPELLRAAGIYKPQEISLIEYASSDVAPISFRTDAFGATDAQCEITGTVIYDNNNIKAILSRGDMDAYLYIENNSEEDITVSCGLADAQNTENTSNIGGILAGNKGILPVFDKSESNTADNPPTAFFEISSVSESLKDSAAVALPIE